MAKTQNPVFQWFCRRIVTEAKGKGINWRLARRIQLHRLLSELLDEFSLRRDRVAWLIRRDLRALDVDEFEAEGLVGWTEDPISLRTEKSAKRFRSIIRNLLGSEVAGTAVVTETRPHYSVEPALRKRLKEDRPLRKEVLRRMGVSATVKTRRKVSRVTRGESRTGDRSCKPDRTFD